MKGIGKIIQQYIDTYPLKGRRTLARLIHEEHPTITFDSARSYIRLLKLKNKVLTEIYPNKIPKILIFDIETMPMQVFVWGLWKQRISHENIISDWFVVSWSAKWLYDNNVMSDVLTTEEVLQKNDKRIIHGIWKLFDQADIVVGHNCDRFDISKLNVRFLLHGMNPPNHYHSIDTLKATKGSFSFSSNRLDYLGKFLMEKGKIETNFQLWTRCFYGDSEALSEMQAYNIEDTLLLEEVYLEMRPWIKNHPNIGLLTESHSESCAICGSTELIQSGHYRTMVSEYNTFRCSKCGGLSRRRVTNIPLSDRKVLLTSLAK